MIRPRHATLADLQAIAQCEQEFPRRSRWTVEQYAELGCNALVIGRPAVGVLWYRTFRGTFEVVGVAVCKHSTGRGYGTALLKRAEQLARASDYRLIALDVLVSNLSARRLYESLGYVKAYTRNGVVRMRAQL